MDEKRKQQIKKAQAKFKQIKANLRPELWQKVETRIQELQTNNSAYLHSLIEKDLQKEEPQTTPINPKSSIKFYILFTVLGFLLGLGAGSLFF